MLEAVKDLLLLDPEALRRENRVRLGVGFRAKSVHEGHKLAQVRGACWALGQMRGD